METREFLTKLQKQLFRMSVIAVLVVLTGCVSLLRIDGPYEGKVVDADTNQPIEGVVVHGDWYLASISPGGAVHTYYDSYETITDKKGQFKIPGKGLLVFSEIDGINLIVFKAGYTQISNVWSGLKNPRAAEIVAWDGDRGTFRLRKMTFAERQKRFVDLPNIPKKKEQLLIIEYNKENSEIGSPLIPLE